MLKELQKDTLKVIPKQLWIIWLFIWSINAYAGLEKSG